MGEIKYLGFMVLPTDFEGKSPFTVKFKMVGSLLVKKYKIDFMDKSPVVEGEFVAGDEYATAEVEHTYTYEQGKSKYTGKAFYPEFTIYGVNEVNGEVMNQFNTAKTGRSLSILVKSSKSDKSE